MQSNDPLIWSLGEEERDEDTVLAIQAWFTFGKRWRMLLLGSGQLKFSGEIPPKSQVRFNCSGLGKTIVRRYGNEKPLEVKLRVRVSWTNVGVLESLSVQLAISLTCMYLFLLQLT